MRPMILVSWYGANAYSLWAHGKDWHDYKCLGSIEQGHLAVSSVGLGAPGWGVNLGGRVKTCLDRGRGGFKN